jgi:hypothetical protein
MLILVIAAIVLSIIFERQERRHAFYESLEYTRLGKKKPEPKPRLPLLESWLCTTIGVLVFSLSTVSIWLTLRVMWTYPQWLANAVVAKSLVDDSLNWSATLAVGIAVTAMGLRSVRRNRRSKTP